MLTQMRSGKEAPSVTQAEKAAAFTALHAGDPFVIPNPWDAGSARVLAALGFKALATTSSGFAFTLGRRDGRVTLEEVIEHVAALDRATELPLSVDLENGYGPDPADAARAIIRAAEAGAGGGSVGGGLTWVAVEALADAAQAIHDSGDFSRLATTLPLDEWLAG